MKVIQSYLLLGSLITLGHFVGQSVGNWPPKCPTDENDVTWALRDPETNDTCILMSGFFKFKIPYKTYSGNTGLAIVHINCHSQISGDCGNGSDFIDDGLPGTQKIVLTWGENKVEFQFRKNYVDNGQDREWESSRRRDFGFYELARVEALISANRQDFPYANDTEKVYNLTGVNLDKMEAPLDLSYYCSSEQNYQLLDGDQADLTTFNVQIQPFFHDSPWDDNDLQFGPRSYCAKDAFRSSLKMAVFIFLGIVAVLLALVLLKRRRRLPYESI